MKYLILSILLLPSLLFADSNTTGNQKFLLISTGVVDTTRNWGDKINENFRIADSSLTAVQIEVDALQVAVSTIEATGGGVVENSTRAATITVGGEIVYSSATPPFFPGAWWSAQKSSCTITSTQFVVKNPSLGGAVFPFYAVQQSSWQWSPYGVLVVSTGSQRSLMKSEAIVVNSSNSFIVGVASAPVSNPASNLGLWFQYWCNP